MFVPAPTSAPKLESRVASRPRPSSARLARNHRNPPNHHMPEPKTQRRCGPKPNLEHPVFGEKCSSGRFLGSARPLDRQLIQVSQSRPGAMPHLGRLSFPPLALCRMPHSLVGCSLLSRRHRAPAITPLPGRQITSRSNPERQCMVSIRSKLARTVQANGASAPMLVPLKLMQSAPLCRLTRNRMV